MQHSDGKTASTEELESDLFKTDKRIVTAVIARVQQDYQLKDWMQIADVGADEGVWGQAAREFFPQSYITGYEKRLITPTPAHFNEWVWGDFLDADEQRKYHLILSNPPYSADENFCLKMHQMLYPQGIAVVLMRLDMLGSSKRYTGLWNTEGNNGTIVPLHRVYTLVQRIPFIRKDGKPKTPTSYHAVFVLKKGYEGEYSGNWISWY